MTTMIYNTTDPLTQKLITRYHLTVEINDISAQLGQRMLALVEDMSRVENYLDKMILISIIEKDTECLDYYTRLKGDLEANDRIYCEDLQDRLTELTTQLDMLQ